MNNPIDAREAEIPPDEERLLIKAYEALRDGSLSLNDETLSKNAPTREQAHAVWMTIAKGILPDDDTVRWARWVARDVVENVLNDKSTQRANRSLKALKLSGHGNSKRADKVNAGTREAIQEAASIYILQAGLAKLKEHKPMTVGRYARSLQGDKRFSKLLPRELEQRLRREIKTQESS
jgi:hypothetical protein